MKIIFLCIFIAGSLVGCGSNPAPESAIKECLDKGNTPYYYSTILATQFICADEHTQIITGDENDK